MLNCCSPPSSRFAHDLRSPLLAISGYSDQLQTIIGQQTISGELQQTAEKLGNSINSFQTFLENLLTWSRIQRGMIKYQPSIVDLVQRFGRKQWWEDLDGKRGRERDDFQVHAAIRIRVTRSYIMANILVIDDIHEVHEFVKRALRPTKYLSI